MNAVLLGGLFLALTAAWAWGCGSRGGVRRWARYGAAAHTAASAPPILLGDLLVRPGPYKLRTDAEYGANLFGAAPLKLASDPVIAWSGCWRGYSSAYGPVWLMLTGGLSVRPARRAPNIVAYKAALRGAHLLDHGGLAGAGRTRPQYVAWGAVFYGWNPLVLIETVGNGHNDVMLALFAALGLLAVAERRWRAAVLLVVVGAMVKVTALILLPALALAWALSLSGLRCRVGAALATVATAALGAAAMYAPLWAGDAWLENIRRNPAANRYYNSMWEFLARRTLRPPDEAALNRLFDDLDLVRNGLLVAAFLGLLWYQARRRAPLEDVWVWTWIAYWLSASWMWPWYFSGDKRRCGAGRAVALLAGRSRSGPALLARHAEPTHDLVARRLQVVRAVRPRPARGGSSIVAGDAPGFAPSALWIPPRAGTSGPPEGSSHDPYSSARRPPASRAERGR
ncbi:MAG: glycosyltransferase 87 family protein [Chloroflexia bacterium]